MAKEKMGKMFIFRVDDNMLQDFKLFCEENCMDVSKRLRRYMKRDIDNWRREKIAKFKANKKKLEKLSKELEKRQIDEDEDDNEDIIEDLD